MNMPNPEPTSGPHRRRKRYHGTHPGRFEQKYKELQPEKYPQMQEHIRSRGRTPAGTHVPVLLAEVLASLRPAPGGTVADCTLGYGGHAMEFLKRIGPSGKLVGFDVDGAQLERTRKRIEPLAADRGVTLGLHHKNFAGLTGVLARGDGCFRVADVSPARAEGILPSVSSSSSSSSSASEEENEKEEAKNAGGTPAARADKMSATRMGETPAARADKMSATHMGETPTLHTGETPTLHTGETPVLLDIIFADLGVSSMQIDDPARGISYKNEGPLDMRMDDRLRQTGAALLATLSEEELSRALWELSDEPDHARIAQFLVNQRQVQPIETTGQLIRLIFNAKGTTEKAWKKQSRYEDLHPAARTFQALRILVNDELGSLRELLRVAPQCLKPGGRIGIISFHSGEDRLVKNAFRDGFHTGIWSATSPKPITPGFAEVRANPRSASAKFRWAVRAV
jgi:16S rRNA (cytosine1402-N4)-methyltransferase